MCFVEASFIHSVHHFNTSYSRLLEKGRMFVFSRDQLKKLLSSSSSSLATPTPETTPLILDIGSGDGHVTDKMREVFQVSTVYVTETSYVMQRVLKRRQYK